MTTLDWILLGFVALTALGGFGTGIVTTLFSFAGLVAGAVVGASLAPQFLSDGADSSYTGLVGVGGAVVGAALFCALARFVGSFVRGGLRLVPPLRIADSVGGAAPRCGLRLHPRLGRRGRRDAADGQAEGAQGGAALAR